MTELLPVIGVLAVASLTPGPNNVLVIQAAATGGGAVVRTIGGVLLGSLLLLTLVAAGIGAIVDHVAGLTTVLGLGGSVWLAWMGVRLAWPARSGSSVADVAPAKASIAGVVAFQLSNPKAWLLVMTAVTTLPPSSGPPMLALLIVLVSGTSLLLWSAAGVILERCLASAGTRRTFDRAMGTALTVSALGGIWHVVV